MKEPSDPDSNFKREPDEGGAKLHGPLPFMKSIEDAAAVCEKEKDPFFLDAFMFEAWMGEVVLDGATEYAEKKNAKDRTMQTGQAWRAFLKIFGHVQDEHFHHVFEHFYRFAAYDDVQAAKLLRAIIALSYEHEYYGDYVGPKTMDLAKQPKEGIRLMQRSVERCCEWIDALLHFETHAVWHMEPAMLDPDPEKRELAALGIGQRNFADKDDFGKLWWEWHHGEAATRYRDSPKWQMVGKAMAEQKERTWMYRELDIVVISLWPLVKLHNWTYRDLQTVARMILPPPHRYPLESEQELATYCQNVLGLRKSGLKGRSNPEGKPRGWEVALKLCPRSAESS